MISEFYTFTFSKLIYCAFTEKTKGFIFFMNTIAFEYQNYKLIDKILIALNVYKIFQNSTT